MSRIYLPLTTSSLNTVVLIESEQSLHTALCSLNNRVLIEGESVANSGLKQVIAPDVYDDLSGPKEVCISPLSLSLSTCSLCVCRILCEEYLECRRSILCLECRRSILCVE